MRDINFDDLDLAGIDLEMIDVVSASDTVAAPAHGASSVFPWAPCSCSCSFYANDVVG